MQKQSSRSFSKVDDISTQLFASVVSEKVESEGSSRTRTRLLKTDKSPADMLMKKLGFTRSEHPTTKSVETHSRFGWFEIVSGPGTGRWFALNKAEISIGRGEDEDIRLNFGDLYVSRERHALLLCDTGTKTVSIVDGGKINPVLLNGKRVRDLQNLKSADEISLGETVLQYIAPSI